VKPNSYQVVNQHYISSVVIFLSTYVTDNTLLRDVSRYLARTRRRLEMLKMMMQAATILAKPWHAVIFAGCSRTSVTKCRSSGRGDGRPPKAR
jgi:hypothetical protein